jgi:hypothetical protein
MRLSIEVTWSQRSGRPRGIGSSRQLGESKDRRRTSCVAVWRGRYWQIAPHGGASGTHGRRTAHPLALFLLAVLIGGIWGRKQHHRLAHMSLADYSVAVCASHSLQYWHLCWCGEQPKGTIQSELGHGVAFLCGISTPSLAAQGEQRRSAYFNINRDNLNYI